MSEKLSPLPYMNRHRRKTSTDQYFDTALKGIVAVILFPSLCLFAVLAIPFWLVGLVVRRFFENDFL